jgi:hypothetical protein
MLGAFLVLAMLVSLPLMWFKRVQASCLWLVLMGVFVVSLVVFVVTFATSGNIVTTDDHKSGVCYGSCGSN